MALHDRLKRKTVAEITTMVEMHGQLLHCRALASPGGHKQLIEALPLPARPWSRDSFDASTEDLVAALNRGERIVLDAGTAEWILSVDADTATVGIAADVEEPNGRGRLRQLFDDLCAKLAPAFGWVDLQADYPQGLLADINRTRISWIFWLNYYGPEYVHALSESFLTGVPSGDAHVNPGGGVSLTFGRGETPVSAQEREALRLYFGTKNQGVKFYRR